MLLLGRVRSFDDDLIPVEVGRDVHVFLRLAEVCAVCRVARLWRDRIGESLRRRFQWDAAHDEFVDDIIEAHVWLSRLEKTGVVRCSTSYHGPTAMSS